MTVTYKYDEQGRRISKVITGNNADSITYSYDGDRLIFEHKNGINISYLYDENGMLYGFVYNNAKYFYIRDVFQNILGIANDGGIPCVIYKYSAYGEISEISGTLANTIGQINSFRYKGYYYDSETEMYYCKSRYYVPEWCRWLNADNMAFFDPSSIKTTNLFSYCSNNPITYKDSGGNFGIVPIIILFAVGAVAILALTGCTAQNEEEEKFKYHYAKDENNLLEGHVNYKITPGTDTAKPIITIYNSYTVKGRDDKQIILNYIINSEEGVNAGLSSKDIDYYIAEWQSHNYAYANPSKVDDMAKTFGVNLGNITERAVHVDLNTDDDFRPFFKVIGAFVKNDY